MSPPGPILFFDGQCGLCARAVRWCLRHDRRGALRFAPLQGSTYAALDDPRKPTDMSTMVLADGRGLHARSDAALRMMHHIGGLWGALSAALRLIPRALRDRAYAYIARGRLRWFGADGCAYVREEDRPRFLP